MNSLLTFRLDELIYDIFLKTLLGTAGLNTPVHNLTVSERVKDLSKSGAATEARVSSESVSDDESTADEFEDASDVVMDDLFPDPIRGTTPPRSRPLSIFSAL